MIDPFVNAAEAKLQTLYDSGMKASYGLIPIGAVVGAWEFQNFLYTAVLSVFGALVGFVVRVILDHYYEKHKAEKAANLKLKKEHEDNHKGENP